MGFVELFMIAVGLSMDAFAVSVCKGLSIGKIRWKHMCIAGIWFGAFQAIMPSIGYFFGSFFTDFVESYAHWVAFLLLAVIGGNMINESLEKEEDELNACMSMKCMFILAVATSIDALAVGVSFAFLRVKLLSAVFFIGCITFVISAIGVKIGSLFGAKYKSKAELAGGIVLIGIGFKILLEGMGILA